MSDIPDVQHVQLAETPHTQTTDAASLTGCFFYNSRSAEPLPTDHEDSATSLVCKVSVMDNWTQVAFCSHPESRLSPNAMQIHVFILCACRLLMHQSSDVLFQRYYNVCEGRLRKFEANHEELRGRLLSHFVLAAWLCSVVCACC